MRNLPSGSLTRSYPNQSAQLQRLARKFKTSLIASLDMTLSNERIAKTLTILRVCAGWSAPLMFINPEG